MNNIFIDIETIPCQSAEYAAEVRANITAPATYKKADSIAQWIAENGDMAAQEAVAKTSFNPALGHICTIGCALGDGDALSWHIDDVRNEAGMIAEFFAWLPEQGQNRFIGHYISGFDLRFIQCRAVVLGVKMPHAVTFPRNPKPWAESVFDTMTAWAGPKDKISLDNLCKALGIEGKGDFDGSMVAKAWADGEHQKIADYCERDVEAVRAVYRKFEAVGF